LLFQKVQDSQKTKGPSASFCKEATSTFGNCWFNYQIVLCFIKNPTLPFEIPSDHYAKTDNTIFNETKTLLK